MAWNDAPPTKEELSVFDKPAAKKADWASTPPSEQELSKLAPAQDPSVLESLARQTASGATAGFDDELNGVLEGAGRAFGVQGLGTAKHLEKGEGLSFKGPTLDFNQILDSYRNARDATRVDKDADMRVNPGTSIAGNLVGGVATGGMLAGAPVAKGAAALEKIGHAAKTGARFGAVAGLGNSNADITKGDVGGALKDTAAGTAIGAGTGAVLQGAFEAGKGLLGKTRLGTAAKIGSEGTILNEEGRGKVVHEAEDLANKYVNAENGALTGKGGLVSEKGQAIKTVLQKAANNKVDLASVSEELEQLFTQLDDRNPLEKADKETLTGLLRNYTQGVEQPRTISAGYKTFSPPEVIPGQPSTREELMAKIAKLNAANKFEGGGASMAGEGPVGAAPYGVQEVPSEQGKLLGVFNKDKGLVGGLKPDMPAVPEQTISLPPKVGTVSQEVMERQGGSTTLPVQDVNKLKKGFSGYTFGQEGNLKTQQADNLSQIAAGKLAAPIENAAPGLETANDEFHNLMENVLKPLDLKNKSGVLHADDQVEKLRNLIRRYKDSTLTGDNSQSQINQAMEALEQIDPKMAQQMKSEIDNTALRVSTARQAQAEPLTMKTPLGAIKGAGLKTANAVGYGVGKANKFLVNLPKQGLKSLGTQLMSSGSETGQKLGNILTQAADRDDVGKNALLFSIMQNPAYRELLNSKFGQNEQ